MKTRALLLCMAVTSLAATSVAAPGRGVSLEASVGGDRTPHYHRRDLPVPQPTAEPQRIVSLAPVVTETLFALGLGARVVGVTRYCDRPDAARALPKVGGYVDPQVEAVLGLDPDLIIAMPSFGQRQALDRLRQRGVPVLVVFADTLDEVQAMAGAIADATWHTQEGTALLGRMKAELESLDALFPKGSKRPRTVLVFQVEPLVVAGPGTFPDEALRLAGGTSAVPHNAPGWPTWSLEALLFLQPEVIVAAEGPGSAARLEALVRAALPGRRPPRVVHAGRPVLMRPGPHLAEDVVALTRLLHPAHGGVPSPKNEGVPSP